MGKGLRTAKRSRKQGFSVLIRCASNGVAEYEIVGLPQEISRLEVAETLFSIALDLHFANRGRKGL